MTNEVDDKIIFLENPNFLIGKIRKNKEKIQTLVMNTYKCDFFLENFSGTFSENLVKILFSGTFTDLKWT